MSFYPKSIVNLIRCLSKLPGIGEKSAERLAMHMLRAPNSEAEALSHAIRELKEKVRLCAECFSLSDAELCHICANPERDASFICVVEQPAEMIAVEKAGFFKGRYHVLQGVLSPIDGIGPDQLRIRELVQKVRNNNVREVLIAVSTTMEGESTAAYIAQELKEFPIRVTRIASGVPIGGDLKFVDQVTLKRALENRHAIRPS